MIKLKKSNCDKEKKLIMWQNSKTKNVTKLIKIKLWHKSKTQIVSKIKNSNCDKSQKLKLWQNWKTQTMTKLKNSNRDQTQKLKWLQNPNLWQNSKIQIATKLKNSNCDDTEKKIVPIFLSHFLKTFFSKNKLVHLQPRDVFRAAFCDTCHVCVCFFLTSLLWINGESAGEGLWPLALMTGERWNVTRDMWNVTCDMWHMFFSLFYNKKNCQECHKKLQTMKING